jgi:hypothetical protein
MLRGRDVQRDYCCNMARVISIVFIRTLYGEGVFPLQVAVLLSQPREDFTGGEFVLTEQRPRMQSRVSVVPLRQGDAVVFPVHHRPSRGIRGHYLASCSMWRRATHRDSLIQFL